MNTIITVTTIMSMYMNLTTDVENNKTRTRTIQWINWPESLFTKTVKEHVFTGLSEISIIKSYFANDSGNRWIVTEANTDKGTKIFFFHLEEGLFPF